MKLTLKHSSIRYLSAVFFSLLLAEPVLLNSQISQDTIKFKIETKRGVPFIGANLDYDFSDGTTHTLDGQFTSDSLGIIWFINPGIEIIDNLLLRFNSSEVMGRGIDFADVEIMRKNILGLEIDCQEIMENITSIDGYTNGLTTLDYVLMIKNILYDIGVPDYLGDFKFNKNNSDLHLEEWVSFNGNFNAESINGLVGYFEQDLNSSVFYNPPNNTPVLEIITENKYVQAGDTIQLMFRADTSVYFNVFQFCLKHEGLKLINTDNPFYQYDSILTMVYYTDNNFTNNSNLTFESTIEGELKDILHLDGCKMKNQYYYGNCYEPGPIKLVIDDASKIEKSVLEDIFCIYPNPTSTLLHIDYDHHKYPDLTLKIYDSYGRDRGQYDNVDSVNTLGLEAGIYFIEFWSDNRRIDIMKFIRE